MGEETFEDSKSQKSQNSTVNCVGIFAGTFDPVHNGHIDVANTAIKYLGLDKVYFMIESQPWGSKNPIEFSHRKNMVKLAMKVYKKLDLLEIPDKRFDIATTLPKIEKQFEGNDLFFIFGGDVFMNMNKENWPKLESLLDHYIVVYERQNITEKDISQHAKELGITLAILPSAHLHLASTDVRLHPHKKAVWLPKEVADYIDKNDLY